MSFPASQFPSQRSPLGDGGHWRANRAAGNNGLPGYGLSQTAGVSGPLNGLFGGGGRTLPMYKDKPYFAPRPTGPRRHQRKVAYGAGGFLVLILLWFFMGGFGGQDTFGLKNSEAGRGVNLWNWMQSVGNSQSEGGTGQKSKSIDWEDRREKVRDAFIVSWDGYAKHGWGTF